MLKKNQLRDQSIALLLTVVTCALLIGLLRLEIVVLNHFIGEKITTNVRISDILIGLTIYLKTAIDFAIFIGRLMDKNSGLRGRIGIEIGTAVGNAAGTMAILLLWSFFKEVTWLLALMVFVAGLVLFRLAQDGLEHVDIHNRKYPKWFVSFVTRFDFLLTRFNDFFGPLLDKIIPSSNLKVTSHASFKALLLMSFTVPFILGLDDFAGYVPLFSVVNVYGFSIGVFVGHMILNILLYLSPKRTIAAVKNPIISFIGSLAFIALGSWGIFEGIKLLTGNH